MSPWNECSCQPSNYAKLGNLSSYVQPATTKFTSPIDGFYESTKSIIQLCTPQNIASNKVIGPLLLVGFVSSTENFFRHLLSLTIQICRDTQKNCQTRTMSVGTVLWHNGHITMRSLLENSSFTNLDDIKRATRELAGHDLSADTQVIAEEYISVCNIRHNIVHSDRIVAGKNAIALNIPSSKKLLEFKADFALLQNAFDICTSLVTVYNKELFESYCKRWAVKWCKNPEITTKERILLFNSIWSSFYSKIDGTNKSITTPLSMSKCRDEVLKFYKSTL